MPRIDRLPALDVDGRVLGDALPAEVRRLELRHALIVTEKSAVSAGLLERVSEALPEELDVTVYEQTPARPTEAAGREAAELYVLLGCDGIIGLGGDASLDLARVVALLATHEGPLSRYGGDGGPGSPIEDTIAPIIAVPTTPGAGRAPGDGVSVVLDDGRSLGLASPFLIPAATIRDPGLAPRVH